MPYIEDGLMEVGDFEIELNYDPAIATWDAEDWLAIDPPDRPKVHVLVYEGERLAAAPFVLLRKHGDERGFVIGGQGIEYWQGGDVGPLIDFAEFLSGRDRLANGRFDGLDKWSLADGSGWAFYNIGGSTGVRILTNPSKDEAVVSEETFDVRPGQEWGAVASIRRAGSGAGKFRLRLVLDGQFLHPNILPGGTFEDPSLWAAGDYLAVEAGGQRSGTRALRIGPIPKPQLIIEPNFAAGGSHWLGVSGLAFTGAALRCFPIPYPQLVLDPSLELGGVGWGVPTHPDIEIASAPGEAHSGTYVMKVGPNIRHQVLINADFGANLDHWYQSSTDSDPDPGTWEWDATAGNNGTGCARTTGWSTAGRPGPETIKYLRADAVLGGGVEPYTVTPGESYEGEGYIKGAPGTEGTAYVSVQIPHPTVPGHDIWMLTEKLTAPPHDDLRWTRVSISEFTIPDGRTQINVLAEVHDHGLGYWYFDTITITRTRGNRSRISLTPLAVEANTDYRVGASVRSAADHQYGSMKLGVTLRQSEDVDPEAFDTSESNTDYTWTRARVDFSPLDGYISAQIWVEGEDIVGAPIWVDDIVLEKVSNNSRETTGEPFPVIPDQRYLLGMTHISQSSVSRGTVTAGVRFTGVDSPPVNVVTLDDTFTGGEIVHPTTEVSPPPGYTVATPFVRFTDVEGGYWDVTEVSLIKLDNNRTSTQSEEFPVTPERTYACVGSVISPANLQEGRVDLSVRLTAPDRPVQEIPIGTIEGTDGIWKLAANNFSPPSGYGTGRLIVVGVDITAASFHLDDFTIVDTDTSTAVYDAVSGSGGAADIEVTTTIPNGAQRIHVSLVAEREGYGWMASQAGLARITAAPATAEDVIRAILVDPDTGAELSVSAGDIDAPDVISTDWEVRNRMLRDAMRELAATVASPALEWYTDTARRQHWGPPAALFTDHAPGTAHQVVFLASDLYVEGLSPMDVDGTNRADRVKLIGSERPGSVTSTTTITATATDVAALSRDYNGRPSNRTLLIEDSVVNHQAAADTKAEAALAQNHRPAVTLQVDLSETRTYPDIRPGDWVYGHKPTAGWVERGRYPVETAEGTLFPRRARVLGRRRELGAGWRIVLRKGPGQEMELPSTSVRWGKNRTTLTLGDRRPADITTDASGRPLTDAFLRARASSPR